jgi:predicted O-methyltransferase YrrM
VRTKSLSAKDVYLNSLTQQNLSERASFKNEKMEYSLARSAELNKAGISLSILEGNWLRFLLMQSNSKKVVEIGSLTGHSALWILAALPIDGRLWALEKDPKHVSICREVLADDRAEVVEGDARLSLEQIAKAGPFDAVFIDGNKSAYLDYLKWADAHIRKGGLIIADNVFLSGAVWGETDHPFSKKQIEIMKSFNESLSDFTRYDSVFIPTDEGMSLSIKKF